MIKHLSAREFTNPAEKLLEEVIFWERHPEIYESLESIIRTNYHIKSKINDKKDGVRLLLDVLVEAKMDKNENLRNLVPMITENFEIKCKE